jgi:amidase
MGRGYHSSRVDGRPTGDWKSVAAKKRQDILSSIPEEWRLSQDVLDTARSTERLVGPFIESLLDTETAGITRLDCRAILDTIGKGDLSAAQVVLSFCKRTAYAHQLVSFRMLRNLLTWNLSLLEL